MARVVKGRLIEVDNKETSISNEVAANIFVSEVK